MAVVYLDFLLGLLTVEAGTVLNALAGSWEPTPHTGLPFPVLIHGEVLSLTAN